MGPGVGPFPTIPHTAHRQTSSAVPRTRTRPIPMNNMKTSMLLLAALALPMLSACEGSGGSDAAKAEGGYATGKAVDRSEEHTSELQSLMRISYAVLCLKKKKKITY